MMEFRLARDASASLDVGWLLACNKVSRPAMALDAELRVLHANRAARELLDSRLASSEILTLPPNVAHALEKARRTRSPFCDVVWRVKGLDARLRLTLGWSTAHSPTLVVAFDLDAGGGLGEDMAVSEAEPASERLAHARLAMHALIDSIPGPSMLVDRELRFRWVNRRYEEWMGRCSADLIGRKLDEFFDEAQALERRPYWVCALSGVPATGERTVVLPNGKPRALRVHYIPVRDDRGRTIGFYTVGSDIQDLREFERRTTFLASHDTLTGLPNRSLFRQMLSQAIANGRRAGQVFAVLVVDLDHFKDINETLGHEVGDELIRLVAQRMRDGLRASDYFGRVSGDGFMVIVEGLPDAAAADAAAAELLDALRRPFEVTGHRIYITASIGICPWPEHGDDPAELLKRADSAMHRAKEAGRNTARRFTASMLEASARRRRLNTDLRLALQNGDLSVHYQPMVSLRSGEVVGAEALLRWHHPESGWISPAEFVPLAEETGFIRDIGEWVFDSAFRQLSRWLERRADFNLSVNLSLQQLRYDQLAQMVGRRLRTHGCDPGRLTLELTETSLLYDAERAKDVLSDLRAIGVRIAVDDFGTGYSSLSHLQRFAVDCVKIDRTFVAEMTSNGANRAIVTAILALARALGMEVIAEGIECEAQRSDLVALGCGTGQGYLFGRAVPAAEFERRFL